jgi:type II secretory pathway pseudopilin PulG
MDARVLGRESEVGGRKSEVGAGHAVRARRERTPCRSSPCRSVPARRSAFTLVELLVVITIIIILMGLLTPVVMIALANAKEARIKLEIATMDGAFKAYKEKRGSYPPSDFTNIGTAKLVGGNLNYTPPSSSSHPQLDALAMHLSKAFPRCNIQTEIAAIIVSNPNYPSTSAPAPVSPSQAIYFWLSGFCTDPEHPISGLLAAGTTREAPFFEFDRARLSFTGLPATAAPCYCAADTPGVPYVYFASQNYLTHAASIYSGPSSFNAIGNKTGYPMTPYDTAVWGQGGTGILRPYAADAYVKNQAPAPVNPNSFQIISAGLDMAFGGGGVDDAGNQDPTYVVAYFKQGTFYGTGDKDNLTNFSDKNLGDAIPR